MTREFGALLAQIVPVLMLALMLELRSILRVAEDENARLRELGVEVRDDLRLARVRQRVANIFGLEVPGKEPDSSSVEVEEEGARSRSEFFYYNDLSKLDGIAFAGIFGVEMLMLARLEIVSLVAAGGAQVSSGEKTLGLYVVLVVLVSLVVVPVGLEVYRQIGLRWSSVVFYAYWAAGLAAMCALVFSVAGYFEKF